MHDFGRQYAQYKTDDTYLNIVDKPFKLFHKTIENSKVGWDAYLLSSASWSPQNVIIEENACFQSEMVDIVILKGGWGNGEDSFL